MIIEKFRIVVKAYKKDYSGSEYEIDLKYRLKIGDKLYAVSYNGSGFKHYKNTIVDINKNGITIKNRYSEVRFLDWIQPGTYRALVFNPFYEFEEGITKDNILKNNISKTKEVFAIKKNELDVVDIEDYINNFKNIIRDFKYVEVKIKQENTSEGQFKFI